MSLALRFVKNYVTWDLSPQDSSWLSKDEIPADPLGDLMTKKNTLSIYVIEDDKSLLDRCISAQAAAKGGIEEMSFILFDEKIIKNIGIKYKCINDGSLLDENVNKLHYNLYELSSQRLVELAKNVFRNCVTDIKDRNQVVQLIKVSIENNWMDESKLNRGIKRGLGAS